MKYFVYTADHADATALYEFPDNVRDCDIERHFEEWVMKEEEIDPIKDPDRADSMYNRARCKELNLQKATLK